MAKTPYELLLLLNSVIVHVNGAEYTPDVRNETPEVSGARIATFLHMLKYDDGHPVESLASAIGGGERGAIYPVLAWVLVRFEELRKRAYLARYLAPLDIPAEILQDRSVADAYGGYKELQEQFKEVHKAVDASRTSGFSPADIQGDIEDMQKDKEQLLAKISRVKRKVQGLPDLEYQLDVVSSLRREQEEELALGERGREQQHLLHRAEMELTRRVDALQSLQGNYIPGNPDALVRKVFDDVQVNRYLVGQKLPGDMEGMEAKIEELQRVLSVPMSSEADLNGIKGEIRRVEAQIRELMDARRANANPLADALAMYRQNAKVAAHKKEAVADQLNSLMEAKGKQDKTIDAKIAQLESTGKRMMQGDEWAAFKAQVKSQTAEFKALKAAKESMEVEQGILARTQTLLEEEAADIAAHLADIEEEAGISGYTKTEAQLEDLVADRAELNSLKAATLEEITGLVDKINAKIAERSRELEPAVRRLQKLKAEAKSVEDEWSAAKEKYDAAKAGTSTNALALAQNVNALAETCGTLESRFHLLQANLANAQGQVEMADAERAAATGGPRVSDRFSTYHELYSKQISEQMSLSKALQKKKRKVRDAHEPNMAQIKMISSLHGLLAAKRASAQRVVDGHRSSQSSVALPVVGGGGANRLVIS